MDSKLIEQWANEIIVRADQIKQELLSSPEVPPTGEKTVAAGDDLQAALDGGGSLVLQDSAQWTRQGGFRFSVEGTSLRGQTDNQLNATQGQCFTVPIGYQDGSLSKLVLKTTGHEVCVQIGLNNTTQNEPAKAPSNLTFKDLAVLSHRGKRAFECNGQSVVFDGIVVKDLYDPEKLDNQAILIMNTPGDIVIQNSHLEAGSENLMVGGDSMKMPVIPTKILIQDSDFTKPIEWKGNSAIPVKNLLELKTGRDVVIRNCHLWNCWKSAQDGYGIVLTPANGIVQNVEIVNVRVHDVAGIFNIVGHSQNDLNPDNRLTMKVSGGSYETNKAEMGGRGIFALIGRGPKSCIFESCYIRVDGPTFIEVYEEKVDVLHILGCDWNYPQYGIRIGGYGHGDNQTGMVGDIRIEGNRITNAHSSFKSRYPNNTYL